jgi:hypothetical protein
MIYDLSNNLDKNKASIKFTELLESGKVIELTAKTKKKSIPQNAYLHVAITLYAIESGYTIKEAKLALKRECAWMYYEKNNIMFLKSTADLDVKERADFIEFIIQFCGVQGIYIPTPEEYILNQIEIDKQINSQKQYL